MYKLILTWAILGLVLTHLIPSQASATILWFDPAQQLYDVGDTLSIDLYADIDANDAIMGFGFDLSFDGGITFITSPGDSGSYLTFDGFTGNSSLFYYEPFFDDGDTISGWRAFLDPDVYGAGILLGSFGFTANDLGIETITLGADSLGPFGTEGLVQGAIGGVAFMPNIPSAQASPVPEPATILLLGSGIIGFAGLKKKIRKA